MATWRHERSPRVSNSLHVGGTRAAALVALTFACEPRVEIGQWACTSAPLAHPSPDSGVPHVSEIPIQFAWTTSFEDGFCGYKQTRGFCYSDTDAEYRLVESPTRSGRFAAAFTVTTDSELSGNQARCVREGVLPRAAYYSAWFYVPAGTTTRGNWNLMHFQGASSSATLHGLWDVSLVASTDGALRPGIFGFLGGGFVNPDLEVELPHDEWFQLTFYLRRAADETGAVALYLNGELLLERTEITTDDSDWAQWYVGNLATNLNPPESTLYVDDVSIQETLEATR